MKYQCFDCDKVFADNNVILIGENTGWGFGTTNILCNECYNKRQQTQKEIEINKQKPMPLKDKLLFVLGCSLFVVLIILIVFDIHFW